jgi:hypothetical protein
MTAGQVAIDRAGLKAATRKGVWAAIWLAVLSLVEFGVFFAFDGEWFQLYALVPFVFAKGWIILDAFMHIRALWGADH